MPEKVGLARRMPVQDANIDSIVHYAPTTSFVQVPFELDVGEVLIVNEHDKDIEVSLNGTTFITMLRQITGVGGKDFQDRFPFAVLGLGGIYIKATVGGGSGDVKILRRK